MEPQHLLAAFKGLPKLDVTPATTAAEADAALRVLAKFDQCIVGVIQFTGETPWERHPGDELLYVVQGSVDVTVLLDEDAQHVTVREGSIFIVPAGRWHRQNPKPSVCLMFITPSQGTDASRSEDPRCD
jgi:quercetin dioxygenase-like cupin family protein